MHSSSLAQTDSRTGIIRRNGLGRRFHCRWPLYERRCIGGKHGRIKINAARCCSCSGMWRGAQERCAPLRHQRAPSCSVEPRHACGSNSGQPRERCRATSDRVQRRALVLCSPRVIARVHKVERSTHSASVIKSNCPACMSVGTLRRRVAHTPLAPRESEHPRAAHGIAHEHGSTREPRVRVKSVNFVPDWQRV